MWLRFTATYEWSFPATRAFGPLVFQAVFDECAAQWAGGNKSERKGLRHFTIPGSAHEA
jgi:hypothetical protein